MSFAFIRAHDKDASTVASPATFTPLLIATPHTIISAWRTSTICPNARYNAILLLSNYAI